MPEVQLPGGEYLAVNHRERHVAIDRIHVADHQGRNRLPEHVARAFSRLATAASARRSPLALPPYIVDTTAVYFWIQWQSESDLAQIRDALETGLAGDTAAAEWLAEEWWKQVPADHPARVDLRYLIWSKSMGMSYQQIAADVRSHLRQRGVKRGVKTGHAATNSEVLTTLNSLVGEGYLRERDASTSAGAGVYERTGTPLAYDPMLRRQRFEI